VKEKQELMDVLSSEGYRLIGDYSLRRYKDAIKEAAKHKKDSEEYKKAMKEAARWEDGGTYKTVLHASFGGFLSSFSGANFTTGAVAGTVNELMLKEMRNIKSPELKQIFSLIAGGAVGKMAGNAPLTDAAIAEQATQHNFLTHEYQVKMAEKNEQQIKTHRERIVALAETNPKEYVQYAYQNGGYWNNSGILVADGVEHPDFLQRGDYEYQYNNAEIIGYASDGTPMVEAASTDTNGNTVMKSYPVWGLPKRAYSESVMKPRKSYAETEPEMTGTQAISNSSQPPINNSVPPMRNLPNSIDIVVWIPIRDNLPHVAIRENYNGKRKNGQELHFGNYATEKPTLVGPGIVLYVTSDGPVQAALEKGEAYTLGTITDPTAIADIIGRQNAVLQSFPKESRSVLRPAVIEEHGGEDIHVYHATGDYAEYSLFRRNCLSFAKYIIGGYSEELNNFSNTSFYDSRLWRDK
jgi:filamentous hemagglutinin family outer membrane protein